MYPALMEIEDKEKISAALDEAEADTTLLSIVAEEKLKEVLSLTDEEAQEDVQDWYDGRREHFETYGLKQEDFVEAYWSSGLHEMRLEWREGALAEFKAERMEARVEVTPRKIH
jgi:hypothetical protein